MRVLEGKTLLRNCHALLRRVDCVAFFERKCRRQDENSWNKQKAPVAGADRRQRLNNSIALGYSSAAILCFEWKWWTPWSFFSTILFLFPNVTQTSLSQEQLPFNMQHKWNDSIRRSMKLKVASSNGSGYIDAAFEVHDCDGQMSIDCGITWLAFRSTRSISIPAAQTKSTR